MVTGSSGGLGLLSARHLTEKGHDVTLHARSQARADDARRALPLVEHVVIGDLATIAGARDVAEQANAHGSYDAVIHNAAVGSRRAARAETADGLEEHFAVNVLAAYLLTCLVGRPERLVYLSSGMHLGASHDLADPQWLSRRWDGGAAYSESKLLDVVLAFAVARLWPDVCSNAVEPGWVPTRMGGAGAPDDLELGADTQAWLAAGDEPEALVSARYFFHRSQRNADPACRDEALQDRLLAYCRELTGVALLSY